MKPIIEQEKNSVTLNLTKPMLVWSVLWAVVWMATDNTAWLWVAAFPWLLSFGFICVMLVFMALVMTGLFLSGKEITLTNNWTGKTRVVRRKR